MEAKDAALIALKTTIRPIVRQIQANPATTDSLRAELGLSLRNLGRRHARRRIGTDRFVPLSFPGDGPEHAVPGRVDRHRGGQDSPLSGPLAEDRRFTRSLERDRFGDDRRIKPGRTISFAPSYAGNELGIRHLIFSIALQRHGEGR